MSILYCALIHNKQKKKLAESSVGKIFQMQVQNLLPQLFKNSVNDRIEFEDYFLTYTRSKEIIYLCVSPKKIGEERPRLFIELLINKLNSKNFDISNETEADGAKSLKELALQGKLQHPIDLEITNFNTGLENSGSMVKEIQKEIDETKKILNKGIKNQVGNMKDLEQGLLKTSENIAVGAEVFKKNSKKAKAETRFCCKPWVIRLTIVTSVILLLFLAYVIVALIRCNSINAFCSSKST